MDAWIRILCVNSGSSSLKVALYEDETPIASGAIEGIGLVESRLTIRDATARVLLDERAAFADVPAALRAALAGAALMEVLSEHQCQGWLEGYLLTGRHGFFSCYEAFIHIVDSMFNQHAKWLKVCHEIPWRRSIASLNYLLSSHVWRQDHNGFSHQDPGFIDHVVNKKAEVIRVYLPPDARLASFGKQMVARQRSEGLDRAMAHEVLARGFGFPEGPVWLGPRRVAFTQIRGQCVSLWEDGRVRTIAPTGGGANGATLGPDGALYVTNNGGLSLGHEGQWRASPEIPGRIQRVTLDGHVSDVATLLPGTLPHRPNDLCFGPDGLLYFTDPHDWENLPALGVGRVDRTSLDGDVELLCDFPDFPNGIAFGPDDRLYVAQSMTQQILVMEPRPGDTPRPFVKLPEGFPDGFCFDRDGRLYAAGSLGDVIVVFEPDGRVARVIDMGKGSEPTNCCIGDGRLYATLSGPGELVALDLRVEALPLYPARR